MSAAKKAEFLPKVFAGGSHAYQQNAYQLYQDNWAVIVGVNVRRVTLLTVSETNHIRSIYDYRKAEAANYHATGTDLLAVYR